MLNNENSSSSDEIVLEQFLKSSQSKKRNIKAQQKLYQQDSYDSESEEEYSFSPHIGAQDRKVKINFTDMSKLGIQLDISKDVPLKKPQSAYVLFGNEQRAVISQKYNGLKVTEVVKMIAREWQKLTKQQRQKYKDAAKRDKERFSQELAKLSKVGDQSLLYQMPKKPLTAYMFFVRQTRVQIAKQMPDIPPLDIMKEVGKEWQICQPKELQKFKQMAKQDDLRYQQEMQKFIQYLNKLRMTDTAPSKIQKQEVAQNKQKIEDGGVSTANITPVKPISDFPIIFSKPKKPLSAYIFYSQEQRDYLKKENPHLSTREVMLQVSQQWASLKKAERHYYVRMASDDKQRFESQMSGLRLGTQQKAPLFNEPQTLQLHQQNSLPVGVYLYNQSSQNPSPSSLLIDVNPQREYQLHQEMQELSPLLGESRMLFEFDYV